MQSAAGWCMGAGYCKKHHWMHMGVLPQFLKGATKSFMSVGHDGEMEDDHWAEMKEFWAQEKASWGKYMDRSSEEQVDQDHKEDSSSMKEDEEKKKQLEAEAK